MTNENVRAAIAEAKRFITKAEVLLKKQKDEEYISSSKESGACRRASMDLTRALADMRIKF